jgi:phage tail sheath protein FI
MPVQPTYPGVYIQEKASGVRTITPVATAITAFVGRARRGNVNEPVRVQSFSEFDRTFGGLWEESTLSYAVHHFFLNGGGDALVVRVVHSDAAQAAISIAGAAGQLQLEARSQGDWGSKLRVRVDHHTRGAQGSEVADTLFNLAIYDSGSGGIETFRNVSTEVAHPRFVKRVLEQSSALVRVKAGTAVPANRPNLHPDPPVGEDPFTKEPPSGFYATGSPGSDGSAIDAKDIEGNESKKEGIFALEKSDLFNILCLPPLTREAEMPDVVWAAAITFCEKRRAILVVDPPSGWTKPSAVEAEGAIDQVVKRHRNAAMYFPRVKMPDPLKDNSTEEFVPCGIVAGIMASTDVQRGVWKAPAGLETRLNGVTELSVKLTDGENGRLNPLGVNCLRTFRDIGHVVWGARTLDGADILASEWKYLPVRRLALFLEESLYRGTQWVVFEPNDEPLWAQIRLNIGAFMQDLFKQGAFQGQTPREAYLVKCDKETTTQNDINRGIVNIVVGFAPLKPAEFVIITIQQLAGQIAT